MPFVTGERSGGSGLVGDKTSDSGPEVGSACVGFMQSNSSSVSIASYANAGTTYATLTSASSSTGGAMTSVSSVAASGSCDASVMVIASFVLGETSSIIGSRASVFNGRRVVVDKAKRVGT